MNDTRPQFDLSPPEEAIVQYDRQFAGVAPLRPDPSKIFVGESEWLEIPDGEGLVEVDGQVQSAPADVEGGRLGYRNCHISTKMFENIVTAGSIIYC